MPSLSATAVMQLHSMAQFRNLTARIQAEFQPPPEEIQPAPPPPRSGDSILSELISLL